MTPRLIAGMLIGFVALLGRPALAGGPTNDSGADICVGVSIGGQPLDRLACLNARLRSAVIAEKTQAAQLSDLEAGPGGSSAPALNLFNESATHERLGDAFGHSPFPQRPEASYANPLTAGK